MKSLLSALFMMLKKRSAFALAGLVIILMFAGLLALLRPDLKQPASLIGHQTKGTDVATTAAVQSAVTEQPTQSPQTAPTNKTTAQSVKPSADSCPLPGATAANCSELIAEQKAPSPTGELVVSESHFEMYVGQARDFTAQAANGVAIMLPGGAWSATPAPIAITSPFIGSPTEKKNTWPVSVSPFANAAPGTYSIVVQASDGTTIYKATITVVVLPGSDPYLGH